MKTLADYELSRLAKEAGFDIACNYYYTDNGDLFYIQEPFSNSEEALFGDPSHPNIVCPQLNDLQDWLLEVKGIWVEVNLSIPNEVRPDRWMVRVKTLPSMEVLYRGFFEEKDEALSEGLKSYFKSEEGV